MGELLVKKLIYYAKKHLGLSFLDSIYISNILYRKLKIEPQGVEEDLSYLDNLETPDLLINELKDYILNNNLVKDEETNLFITEIMGDLTPLPSQVVDKFNQYKKESIDNACNYLYELQIKNNYIQKTAVDKNIYWKANFPNNYLEITINLSKPEKSVKEIINAKENKDLNYPKCLLCLENLGYQGRSNHPARENIRIIPLKLNNEDWFMQYSPYVYYDHHCIVIKNNHEEMKINLENIKAQFDFVDQFPNYFIGANADLPIVGGSILSHEHFQGGKHLLPLFFAKTKYEIINNQDLKLSYLDWYNSVLLIRGKDKDKVLNLAALIKEKWDNYSNKEINVIAKTNVQHNTLNPILRKVNNEYYLYLILRNNRCSDEYEEGIFHVHPKFFHIKKECIGLIEAQGLFILPGRLAEEMKEVEYLLNNKNIDLDTYFKQNIDIQKHKDMIIYLREKDGASKDLIKEYINDVCKSILECTAVFKNDENGQKNLKEFLNELKEDYICQY